VLQLHAGVCGAPQLHGCGSKTIQQQRQISYNYKLLEVELLSVACWNVVHSPLARVTSPDTSSHTSQVTAHVPEVAYPHWHAIHRELVWNT
jgi:hypothetical protein